MGKPFDATLNHLIDAHAADWVGYVCGRLGLIPGPAEALDTDLSKTLQADKLFRLAGPPAAVLHVEFESTGRLGIPDELLRYNVLARMANGKLPVHIVLFLLRPKATARDLTGRLRVPGADGAVYLTFRYAVVRVWREPAESFLAAGPGLAPLALLTNEAAADLRNTLTRFRDRLRADRVPSNVEEGLIGSSYVLCGLRYKPHQIDDLYRGLSMTLEDSTTYQLILKRGIDQGRTEGLSEGMAQEAQRLLLRVGGKRFGPAPAGAEAAFREIADRDRLERMADRIFDAAGWDDLLATP